MYKFECFQLRCRALFRLHNDTLDAACVIVDLGACLLNFDHALNWRGRRRRAGGLRGTWTLETSSRLAAEQRIKDPSILGPKSARAIDYVKPVPRGPVRVREEKCKGRAVIRPLRTNAGVHLSLLVTRNVAEVGYSGNGFSREQRTACELACTVGHIADGCDYARGCIDCDA